MMVLKCQERTLAGEQGLDWEREEPTSPHSPTAATWAPGAVRGSIRPGATRMGALRSGLPIRFPY